MVASFDKSVHASRGKDDWRTPIWLFDALNAEFSFMLDVAADATNCFALPYLGPGSPLDEDALSVPWAKMNWCNPPYSKSKQFIAKAAEEQAKGNTTVMLLPARTDTRAFHRDIWDNRGNHPRTGIEVRFIAGRLRFVGATTSAPFPSMIVIFRGLK